MSFLKKPAVAAVICVLAVILSTVFSTRARLNPQCDALRDAFTAPGGIAEQLETVADVGTALAQMAEAYGVDDFDTFDAADLCVALRIQAARGEPDGLMSLYSLLKARLSTICAALQRAELSEKDAALFADYQTKLNAAQAMISVDPYNDSVRVFLREELGFFSRFMAKLCGVRLPAEFA